MGRLIYADVLVKYIKDFQDYMVKVNHKPVPVDARSILDVFVEMVEKQPTAYDLEAVVQQLGELLEELSDCGDDWYTSEKLNQAIEIVKGGSTIFECEWKYNEDEYYWESSCEHLHIFMSDGPEENGYKVCPYCGKKIKVV